MTTTERIRKYGWTRCPLFAAFALIAVGCAAKGAETAPAKEPKSEAAPEAPAAEQSGGGAYEQAPASAAPSEAPAPNAFPGSTRAGETEDESRQEKESQRSLADLSRDMDRALSLSVPDCSQASLLRDQICDLATSICRLADRNPSKEELANQCKDGQSRCERASQRIRRACP